MVPEHYKPARAVALCSILDQITRQHTHTHARTHAHSRLSGLGKPIWHDSSFLSSRDNSAKRVFKHTEGESERVKGIWGRRGGRWRDRDTLHRQNKNPKDRRLSALHKSFWSRVWALLRNGSPPEREKGIQEKHRGLWASCPET